jgi:hypothetical protein
MKTILIAAAAVFGIVGVASAQQAPVRVGNFAPNVLRAFDEQASMTGVGVDTSRTASIGGRAATSSVERAARPDWSPCLDIVSAQSCPSIRSGR